ncbi:hypothetical protein DL96DRAFT_1706668 [Flagelloscypha sp. PMI_526]|nr:hypothetical protein DL96DRAFT_1706668 [Flagelloscypha sp. PMI_526]
MNHLSSVFPVLPPEIVAYIVVIAADHAFMTASNLCHVSTQFCFWAQPRLYHHLIILPQIHGPFQTVVEVVEELVHNSALARRPRIAKQVRTIILGHQIPLPLLRALIGLTPNLANLSWAEHIHVATSTISLPQLSNLRRLAFNGSSQDLLALPSMLASQLTHLHFFCQPDTHAPTHALSAVKDLKDSLQNLTHLCLRFLTLPQYEQHKFGSAVKGSLPQKTRVFIIYLQGDTNGVSPGTLPRRLIDGYFDRRIVVANHEHFQPRWILYFTPIQPSISAVKTGEGSAKLLDLIGFGDGMWEAAEKKLARRDKYHKFG